MLNWKIFFSTLFHNISHNIVNIFRHKHFLYHATAIILTYIIVVSGFDWAYFLATRSHIFRITSIPSIFVGGILPIILPLLILSISALRRNRKGIFTALALWQSAILGSLISSTYKAFTGRIHPDYIFSTKDILIDNSHGFRFGFLEGGVFWGWPSSHTTIAFAMAVTLYFIFKNKKRIRPLLYIYLIYAFYIGLGVSVSIHWFSEFIAGALIGIAIGTVVGHSFKEIIYPEK